MIEFVEGQIVSWNNGECEGSWIKRGVDSFDFVQPSGTYGHAYTFSIRRSDLRPAEPRAGDVVRVVALHPDSCFSGKLFPDAKVTIGEERTLLSIKDTSTKSEWSVAGLEGASVPGCCKLIVIRRASTPAVETVPKWEPKVGDHVSGIGVGWKDGDECGRFEGVVVALINGRVSIRPTRLPPDVGGASMRFEFCLYGSDSLRPISPPPDGSAEAPAGSLRDAQPSGGGSSKKDPYAEHERKLRQLPDMQRIKMKLWFESEDKLATARRSKLEQAKAELDRKLPSTHPSTWPEGAGEELRCT